MFATGEVQHTWDRLQRQVLIVGEPPRLAAAITATREGFFRLAEPRYREVLAMARAGEARPVTLPAWRALTAAVTRLAGGNVAAEVPERGRHDEIGAMAAAIEVFRETAVELRRTNLRFDAAGRVQNPFPDQLNESDFFRERDEFGRRDETSHQMAPAHQRLESGDPARARVQHGLKIDQSFVAGLGIERTECTAIARAVIDLCADLGIAVTAEGAETEEQLRWLVTAGSVEAQGYLFSRPVPAETVLGLIATLTAEAERAAVAA
jgi:hypothetical protein